MVSVRSELIDTFTWRVPFHIPMVLLLDLPNAPLTAHPCWNILPFKVVKTEQKWLQELLKILLFLLPLLRQPGAPLGRSGLHPKEPTRELLGPVSDPLLVAPCTLHGPPSQRTIRALPSTYCLPSCWSTLTGPAPWFLSIFTCTHPSVPWVNQCGLGGNSQESSLSL